MSYTISHRVPEYEPGQLPPEYQWNSKQLRASTGWRADKLGHLCTRSNNHLPHVVIRQGMQTTRFFNPRQVAQWMKEEAHRRKAS